MMYNKRKYGTYCSNIFSYKNIYYQYCIFDEKVGKKDQSWHRVIFPKVILCVLCEMYAPWHLLGYNLRKEPNETTLHRAKPSFLSIQDKRCNWLMNQIRTRAIRQLTGLSEKSKNLHDELDLGMMGLGDGVEDGDNGGDTALTPQHHLVGGCTK